MGFLLCCVGLKNDYFFGLPDDDDDDEDEEELLEELEAGLRIS